ncbi:MAG: hypothetical protein R6V50_01070 [Thermoplasmatota archaeon]
MKEKIIVGILCLMLLVPLFSVAEQITEKETYKKNNEIRPLFLDDADVPVWEVGDSWTYSIEAMQFIIDENVSEEFTIIINAQFDDFTLEVSDISGDSYKVSILETIINGDFLVETDLGEGPIEILGILENTKLNGYLIFNKNDLGIQHFFGEIDGRISINILKQPYINVSVFPKIPVPMQIKLDVDLMDTALPIIQFPLNESGQTWGLPALNISIDGTIESIWFRIFNFINQKIRQWNLIPPIAKLLQTNPAELQKISDIMDDILPIINIKHVLGEYLNIPNVFSIPEIPADFFYCDNIVEVTVPAGTFEAYEINIVGEIATLYYSPEVKNIIKIEGVFKDVLPFLTNINAELVSYS